MKTRRIALTILALIAGLALLGGPVYAGTITVDNTDAGCVTGSGQPDPYAAVYCDIQDAIDDGAAGDTINVSGGPYSLSGTINLNKTDLTLAGDESNPTQVQADNSVGYAFSITATGVTLRHLDIEKTDKAGPQNLIYVGADDTTIEHNQIHGQYVLGDPDVSRAMEVTYGLSGLYFAHNEIFSLRQPAYINGSTASPTTGTIEANTVYGTKGWVIDGANMAFTDNTWGTGALANYMDIAILSSTDASYYPDIVAISEVNNDAVIEDQRPSPAVLSIVHVDDDAPAGGDGTVTRPYQSITPAITRVAAGGKILVAAGTYVETVTVPPGADMNILGAGQDVTTWIAPADDPSRMSCIYSSLQGYTGATTLDVSGFTFSVQDNEISSSGIAIAINRASQGSLYLSIHDNRFIETTAVAGETANSMLLCHNRFAARGAEAPVKIYNNLDETSGGIAMSNTRAFDIYNNTFDGSSDALYIGYGCPENTTVGDHHIYNNTFKNAANVYPDGPWPAILFAYYGSGTGMTFLPSTIEHNFFEDNEVAVGYQMDSNIVYPADLIRGNSFEGSVEYALQVWGAYPTTVDASGNWWGIATPDGVAAEVSANVDYTPWLDGGADTSADPGFQGDFSTLHVDDDSPQVGTTGRVQEGIDMVSGSTVYVAPGTYNERVTIDKSVDLRGAQYGVDPTADGARTDPANESTITEAGLSTPNPDVLIEVPSGVTGVSIDGFTLVGDPTNATADTSVLRIWDDDISVSNNVIDGRYGVLFKGADSLAVHRNRLIVNKAGVTVQPNPATGVVVSDNVLEIGTSPASDAMAIYMTACDECSVTGNTAALFTNGRGFAGSNLGHLTISGNAFTENKDAISIWGDSTFIDVTENVLAQSKRHGINIKGQDITISGNEITDNEDTGINIDRHVIDTERVDISCNIISGNANFGVKVNVDNVGETVNAENNWWGDASGPLDDSDDTATGGLYNPDGEGDTVSDNVDYDPWAKSTPPCGPTAVCLASFTARLGVGSVHLAWETGAEIDNAGFNLYRATAADGPYAKVNGAFIAAQGDPTSGASYAFTDEGLAPGIYFYKLEDVDTGGVATLHGPVSAVALPRLRRPLYRPTLP